MPARSRSSACVRSRRRRAGAMSRGFRLASLPGATAVRCQWLTLCRGCRCEGASDGSGRSCAARRWRGERVVANLRVGRAQSRRDLAARSANRRERREVRSGGKKLRSDTTALACKLRLRLTLTAVCSRDTPTALEISLRLTQLAPWPGCKRQVFVKY